MNIDDRVGPVGSTYRGKIVESVDRWHLVHLDGPSRNAERNFMGRGLEWFHESDLLPVCKPQELKLTHKALANLLTV
jgi:hypothetical protein